MTSLNDDVAQTDQNAASASGATDAASEPDLSAPPAEDSAHESRASKKSSAPSSNLDVWLNRAIWAAVILVLVLGASFGYGYYDQQKRARAANPALNLIDALTGQLAKTPKDAGLHLRLAEALAAAEYYPEAKQEIATALKLSPGNAVAYQDLAQIALTQKDMVAAQKYLTELLTITSTGDYQDVNSRRGFALFSLGEIAIEQKRWYDAIGYLNAAIRVDKTASDSYLRLAQAYHGAGDDTSAFQNVGIALKFDPKYAEALYFEGTLYMAKGDNVNAAWDFRAALNKLPDQPEIQQAMASLGTYDSWLKKAQGAYADGGLATALDDVRIARAIEPSSFDAALLNGQILMQQNSYVDALDAFKTAVQIQPKNADAVAGLAKATQLAKGSTSK